MKVLHVGAGGAHLPPIFDGWDETRLDIDPETHPDVLAPMTNMGDIGPFDAVFCSHCLEHLYPHEVDAALAEMKRVCPKGSVTIVVPDLEGVEATEDVLFVSPAGPITGLDLLYGLRSALQKRPYMAHHNAFTESTLRAAFERAGLESIQTFRGADYNLMGVAHANHPEERSHPREDAPRCAEHDHRNAEGHALAAD